MVMIYILLSMFEYHTPFFIGIIITVVIIIVTIIVIKP